ncbi:aspartyl-tRNA amidotransferase subunit B [Prolixibacter bellariivorans]|uniref:Aspartyl-tRNA amidotransferase subunit B n=1 Tax=Prolixibacter bellariivorans TaxID=314319 RepID=A0A5M4AZR4_9BACT|nr:GatB/YqeY domain-containing protein [Prolixibacter bellariivorans]GET33141.1 aspartyl-tRNA amidotransferase subunit B [Prolixibacter bellariivorans]
MSLFDQINADIKSAMLARDKVKLEALRNIKKVLIEAKTAKSGQEELADDVALKAIAKLAKQGKDSANIYKEQNRQDLYDQEMDQVKVFEAYLPSKMSDEELAAAVKDVIAEVGADSMKDMGKVMGAANAKLAGRADGKDIAAKVKSLLS